MCCFTSIIKGPAGASALMCSAISAACCSSSLQQWKPHKTQCPPPPPDVLELLQPDVVPLVLCIFHVYLSLPLASYITQIHLDSRPALIGPVSAFPSRPRPTGGICARESAQPITGAP